MSKTDGGPAFPIPSPEMVREGQSVRETQGMTLRDWFTGQALAGWLAGIAGGIAGQDWMDKYRPTTKTWSRHQEAVAEACVGYADATLNALAAREPAGEEEPEGWWCPACRVAVDGSRVTFEERHEVCGTPVGAPPASEEEPKLKLACECGHCIFSHREGPRHGFHEIRELTTCTKCDCRKWNPTAPDLRAELEAATATAEAEQRAAARARRQRDTALAEVERLRNGIEGVVAKPWAFAVAVQDRLRALLEGGGE